MQESGSHIASIKSNTFHPNNHVYISKNHFIVDDVKYDFYKLPFKVNDCSKIDYDTTPYPFYELTRANNANAFIQDANNMIGSTIEEHTTYSTPTFKDNLVMLKSCLEFHPIL